MLKTWRSTAVLVAIFIVCSISTVNCQSCKGKTMIHAGGLTNFDKKLILEMHNRLRQSIAMGHVTDQPMAANMLEMKWDEELAARAQYWSEQCISGHDENRHVARFPVGQNIAMTWTTRSPNSVYSMMPDFGDQIDKWFKEVQKYTFKKTGFELGTGHYTQLIWSDTNLVGCGYAFYFDPSRGYTKLYVCNYGPGGNVIGVTPYEAGATNCASYGLQPSTQYSGLCDKADVYSEVGLNNLLG